MTWTMIVLFSLIGQVCPPCEVTFTVTDTLGGSEDPASPGPVAEILRLPDGRGFLLSSETMESEVLVFDSTGIFSSTIGRRGQGPGEWQRSVNFAYGHGEIWLLEARTDRVHVFDEDLRFLRSIRLPGMGWSVAPHPEGGWVVASTRRSSEGITTLHLIAPDGAIQRSFAPVGFTAPLTTLARRVIVDSAGFIWSITMAGHVEIFAEGGALVAGLQLGGDGFEIPFDGLAGRGRRPTMVMDALLDGDGVLWVFLVTPDDGVDDPRESTPRPQSPEGLSDTLIRLIRWDDELEEFHETRFENIIRPLGAAWAFDLVDLPSGDRKVRVGRLEVVR